MAKRKNRKKEFKLGLKRQGVVRTDAVTKAHPLTSSVTSAATLSLEEFSALAAVDGIRAHLVEKLYQAGVRSMADFKDKTEEELLALKGIGPATLAKLKENGVRFKA